jgi:UDP-2,3-diacylglucosamine hydrolase
MPPYFAILPAMANVRKRAAGIATTGKVYFVADAHLGANEEIEKHTVPALLSLFDEVKREKASLYVLGDLFDFWFEFRHSVPKIHIEVVAKLYELKLAGCTIVFVTGNHDFWMEGFLRRELAQVVSSDWFECDIQGKRVCMSHGDGLASGDAGYKLLKKILRSKVNVALYRLIHPDFAIPFAFACSRLSRKTSVAEMKFIAEKLFREVALNRFADGFDVVVLGHVHLPYEREQDGKEFFIVGDWIENLSYLVMESGKISRKVWGRTPA